MVFFIVGPTASGKSEIAADVAARCGAEIVNADAFQIYRGVPADGTTAKQRCVRRTAWLIRPVTEKMSAEKFRALALSAIEEINRRGKLAIVVGGSGLYIKALTHGLAPLPAVEPKLRAELNALSLDELNARLAGVDPLGAKKIDQQNKRRVVRALEIFMQTNAPASAQRSQWNHARRVVNGFARSPNSIYASINVWRRCFSTALRRKSRDWRGRSDRRQGSWFRPNPRSVGGKNKSRRMSGDDSAGNPPVCQKTVDLVSAPN
jgi:tRNA dimethylallyltransferase